MKEVEETGMDMDDDSPVLHLVIAMGKEPTKEERMPKNKRFLRRGYEKGAMKAPPKFKDCDED